MRISIYLMIEEYHIAGEHYDAKTSMYQTRDNALKGFNSRVNELKESYEKNHPGMVGDSQTPEGETMPYQYDEFITENNDKMPRFDIWYDKDSTYEFNTLRIIRKRIQVRNEETEK